MKKIKIIVVGFGTIGRGITDVINMKRELMKKQYGVDISIVAVCDIDGALVSKEGLSVSGDTNILTHKAFRKIGSKRVLEEVEADIVLELTPGNIETGEPGISHIKTALLNGKNVVTSNKAPLALKFTELMNLAKREDLDLRYEATVGGAIPLINLYRETLQANMIESIYGILNGTTNFILTKMEKERVKFDVALNEAKEIGIAEKDMRYDLEGIDTAAKIVILANSLLGKDVTIKDVKIGGITDITEEAIHLAKRHNSVIKLIGDANLLEVSPRLIPESHPLNVDGTLNAVMFKTDIAGEITIVGRGAGQRETASSLLSDIINVSKR